MEIRLQKTPDGVLPTPYNDPSCHCSHYEEDILLFTDAATILIHKIPSVNVNYFVNNNRIKRTHNKIHLVESLD